MRYIIKTAGNTVRITAKKTGVRLKVCGMKQGDNILQIAALQPDYMGFIFWRKSPRFFDGDLPELPAYIKKIGVFVDAAFNEVLWAVKKYGLHGVQLHGKETPEYCTALKVYDPVLSPISVIKVFTVKHKFDFAILAPYEVCCDYFLFDTKGRLPGGNGTVFDWNILQGYPSGKPFFLSGGIGMETFTSLKMILDTSLPVHAIDINSKFEIAPGIKSAKRICAFNTRLSLYRL